MDDLQVQEKPADGDGEIGSGDMVPLRDRFMFFVALVFLLGIAVVLPPSEPRIKIVAGDQLIQPVVTELRQLEVTARKQPGDVPAAIEEVKSVLRELPGRFNVLLEEQQKAFEKGEPFDLQAKARDLEGLPDRTSSLGLVERLVVSPWFLIGMATLWFLVLVDGVVGLFQPSDGFFRAWKRFFLVVLIPPMRMAFSPARPNCKVWFPFGGWLPVNKQSVEVLEMVMAVPMLFVTLSIVPIEVVERVFPHWVLKYPPLSISLHLLGAVIWLALVLEFVMLLGVAQKKISFCLRHWVNIIIILLPLIGFLRILRVARLFRLIRAGNLMRVYRIRGVYARAMRFAIMFSLLERFLRRKPARYLAKLEDQIEEKKAELVRLELEVANFKKENGKGEMPEIGVLDRG